MIKFLPAQFFFSKENEQRFQRQLNHSSRKLISILFLVVSAILLSLTAISVIYSGLTENLVTNGIRMVMVVLSISIIFLCKLSSDKALDRHFFFYAMLFCALNAALFWTYAMANGELKEGGPMLVVAMLVAIPMLHLGHKLVLWGILGFGLFCIQWFSGIDISWTLYFYIAMGTVMATIQYELDILLRTQFRAKLVEAEKAKTDQLTGLYNRHSFDLEFNQVLSTLPAGNSLAIAMIDIDYFKKYNDNYGHLEGDLALVKVATLLNQQGADIVVRFGGEEFILIKVFNASEDKWLADLPEQCETLNLAHKYSPFGYLTVSAGVVMTDSSGTPPTSKELLTLADALMYQAKTSGRNKVIGQVFAKPNE